MSYQDDEKADTVNEHYPAWDNGPEGIDDLPRFHSYAEKLADTTSAQHDNLLVIPLGKGIPVTIQEVVDAIAGYTDELHLQGTARVFIELDPMMLGELRTEIDAGRVTFAWPATLRIDAGGDVILTATSGDLAQFGEK